MRRHDLAIDANFGFFAFDQVGDFERQRAGHAIPLEMLRRDEGVDAVRSHVIDINGSVTGLAPRSVRSYGDSAQGRGGNGHNGAVNW